MARNIEIKAQLADIEAVTHRAAAIADSGPTLIVQDDTFFACSTGRLKLRTFPDGSGQLIFYRRADQQGPKESFYSIAPVADAGAMRTTLTHASGETGRVVKLRTLFLVGRTRVHLDRVDGLGDFVELEVVLADDEPADAGIDEAHGLMRTLGIASDALVEGAYVDLLASARLQPAALRQSLGMVSLVVRDYDEAIAFFVGKLGFELVEDSFVPEQSKRWVVVAPPGDGGSRLLLARASTPEQAARIGSQTGGRVFLFLYTDDFHRDHARFSAQGVVFVRGPAHAPYGTVAVFEDLYGNLWDLVELKRSDV